MAEDCLGCKIPCASSPDKFSLCQDTCLTLVGIELAAKKHKSRKNRQDNGGGSAATSTVARLAQRVLLDLEPGCAEVDQQAVLDPGSAKVAKDLGGVFLRCMFEFVFSSFTRHHIVWAQP